MGSCISKRIALAILLSLFSAIFPASGQTSRGSVSGLVTDSSKAPVSGAVVELTNTSTNVARRTESNDSGLYRFDAVDPGPYQIRVAHAGFTTFSQPGFAVNAAQSVSIDATLQVGEVQQIVEVVDSAVQLNTEAPVRGKNVATHDILELPYASRNPVALSLTAPGVTTTKFATPSNTIIVNGGRGRSNNFMIDGTDNNDISVAGQAFEVLNPGTVQEVSVQTTQFDSEFGRAGGGVVNVITKSGTNDFHGTAGFVLDSTRDDAITSSLSQDPGIVARGHLPPGTEQQFDGTLGGRVIRDRTFFFINYLEARQFSSSTTELIAPTAGGRAALRGLFPAGTNANADLMLNITNGYDGVTRTFTQSAGQGRPNIEFGRLISPYAQTQRVRQYGAKIDHRFNDRDLLSGRYLIDDRDQPKGGDTLSFPTFHTSQVQRTKSAAMFYTHVFSPTWTNELRPAYTRFVLDVPLDPASPLALTLPQIAIAGINTLTSLPWGVQSNIPQGRTFNNYTLQDTMSVIRGKHSVRFGFDVMNQRARQAAPLNARGQISYGSSSVAGQTYTGLANFLDNYGGAGSVARTFGNPNYYPSLTRQAYFVQDRWRATTGLTLSLGLRYEYFGQPMNVVRTPGFTGLFNVDPVTFDSPFGKPNRIAADKNNFSPMIGVAYSPDFGSGLLGWLFGPRRSSIRTGYGLGYDSFFNNITSNVVGTAPTSLAVTVSSQATAADPRGLANFNTQFPSVAPAPNPLLSQNGIATNLVNPYYQRWSFSIQRELPRSWVMEVAYVGSKGTKLFANEDLNPLVPVNMRAPVPASVPASRQMARLDPLQGPRTIRTNGGDSNYNAGQLEVKRRFASGFSFSGAYTFSKLIDNVSEIFSYGNSSNIASQGVPSLYGGLQLDRAVGFFDRTHRAVFTYYYELPWLKSQQGVIGHALGGWRIGGITAYESGVPFTVVNGQDADGLGGSTGDRPDYNPNGRENVRAVPNASSPTGYVNPDAGNAPIDPSQAEFIGLPTNSGLTRTRPGTLGRNTERGPGLKNWDVNLVKNLRLTERAQLQFRAEFYNIFNTPQYGTISRSPFAPSQNAQTIPASVFNSSPGLFLNRQTADGGGRVIRWQLRLYF